MNSERAILNLIAQYTHYLDQAAFDKIGELFANGILITPSNTLEGKEAVANLLRDNIQVYPGGTLQTAHITTNTVLDIDEGAGTASSISYLTVMQQDTERLLPLQAIMTGRYHDQFRRTGEKWHFGTRKLVVTLLGDISHHAKAGSSEARIAEGHE